MNSPTQPSEETLAPQQRQLIRRMRRLMAVALLTLLAGIFAVFAAIYYRVSSTPSSQGAIPAITNALPKGSRVISTAVSDGRIAVTIERDGITEIRVFDLVTLQLRGTLRLEPQ
jgi:hypothetical protein